MLKVLWAAPEQGVAGCKSLQVPLKLGHSTWGSCNSQCLQALPGQLVAMTAHQSSRAGQG